MKTLFSAVTLVLAAAVPAFAGVIHEDGLAERTSPDGAVHVRFITGPLGIEGKGIAVNRMAMEPGAKIALHNHPTSDEIAVVVKGSGYLTLDGVRLRIQPGDTEFIPRGHMHAVDVDPAGPMEILQIYNPATPEQRFMAWKVTRPAAEPAKKP